MNNDTQNSADAPRMADIYRAREAKHYQHRAWVLGRLIFTTCYQGANAPLIDGCNTSFPDGQVCKGIAILLTPWRRNKYWESLPQRALVIAWKPK